jgi:glyoxylase-like metal-dependent hydrolase (beta-lactamase superfamily II)
MGAYMASLQRRLERASECDLLLPGHGEPVSHPVPFIRSMLGHRRAREAAIRERLAAGDETTLAIVERIYAGLAPHLKGAARLSVLAHLEDLMLQGLVAMVEGVGITARYALR